MKSRHSLLIALFFLSISATAQNRMLTLDDIFSPDPAKRVRFNGNPMTVQWTPDGKAFRQVINGRLMRVDAMTGQAVPYIDTGRLTAALLRSGVKTDEAAAMANSAALRFNADESGILLNFLNDVWYYEVATGNIRRLTNNREPELEADFSPDGRWVSFVRGNNLYAVDAEKANEKQLTRDGREGDKPIYNGYLDWVYEEELYGRGQKRGYWWSPDSRFIAFIRLDETPVPHFVLPNDIPTDQLIENTNYPQAGDPNPLVRVGIADVNKTSLVPNAGRIPKIGEKLPPQLLRIGDNAKFADISNYKPEDLLIARVVWSPDSRAVVFQALNREQTWLDLDAADAASGKVTKLLTETTPTYVNVYGNPEFLKDGTAVWQSARNGWKHLFFYGNDGQLIRPLTSGRWEVRTLYGVDEKNGWVYFSSTKDSPIAENIYRVRLTGGAIERLSQGPGWHTASFDPTFLHYVDTWTDAATPPQARLYRADGTLERVVNENKVAELGQYKMNRPEFLQVDTRDGFQMEAMMIKPPDFDPSKKYPVLIYTYAGAHVQSVLDRWLGARYLWHQMMAEKGYIIWICDNRSASGKGEESVWPVYKNFGPLELRDIEDGVSYLKSQPFVDPARIGIWGWSNGGFMTSYALTHSKSFKIGIAGGTVSDWRLYDSIFTERYMMTPDNNRKGYDDSSVLRAAANLSGRLLLIHGVMDNNVHMQNTMQLAYELQKADKQFDLMVYPTQRHGIADPAQVKHWYSMMTDFVLKNL